MIISNTMKKPSIDSNQSGSSSDSIPSILIAKYRKTGNKDAIVELLENYHSRIIMQAASYVNREEIKDIKQDLFLKLCEKITDKNPKDPNKFSAWFSKVIKHYLYDKYVRKKYHDLIEELPEYPAALDKQIYAELDLRLVRACIEELKPVYRLIIELAFYKDMKNQEIVKHTHFTYNQVRSLKENALKKLARLLEEKGINGNDLLNNL